MSEMIAFCGLACDECGALLATKNNDDEKRAEVSAIWSKMFKTDIRPEEINCEGCKSTGSVHFAHCKVCEIRSCAQEKKVDNCGRCADYPCDKLDEIFEAAPEAKIRLDRIQASL